MVIADYSEVKYARLMERCDIEWLRRMHNDDSTIKMLTDVNHVSQAEQERWFEKVSLSDSSRRYVIVHRGLLVGVIRVDNLDLVNRSVMIGVDIHRGYRRQGHATWAYEYIMRYMFLDMGIHRVYLKVLDSNEAARGLYKKLGFKEEGVERDAIFRAGEWHDYILMSILKDEYDAR